MAANFSTIWLEILSLGASPTDQKGQWVSILVRWTKRKTARQTDFSSFVEEHQVKIDAYLSAENGWNGFGKVENAVVELLSIHSHER